MYICLFTYINNVKIDSGYILINIYLIKMVTKYNRDLCLIYILYNYTNYTLLNMSVLYLL